MIHIITGKMSFSVFQIERLLHANRQALSSHSIFYPIVGTEDWNHINIYREVTSSLEFLSDNGSLSQLASKIKTIYSKNPKANIVLSFSRLSVSYVGLIKRICESFQYIGEVVLHYFVEPQIDILKWEWMRRGRLNEQSLSYLDWALWKLETNHYGFNYLREYRKLLACNHTVSIKAGTVRNYSEMFLNFLLEIENRDYSDIFIDSFLPLEYEQSIQPKLLELIEKRFGESNTALLDYYSSSSSIN